MVLIVWLKGVSVRPVKPAFSAHFAEKLRETVSERSVVPDLGSPPGKFPARPEIKGEKERNLVAKEMSLEPGQRGTWLSRP